MQNKLQELTDKLYKEGLSKGREEGDRILSEAREEAAKIVAKAEQEAKKIVAKADKDAEDIAAKTAADVRTASAQVLQQTRKDIETILVNAVCTEGVKQTLSTADILKEAVLSTARNFNASEPVDLEVVLPEKLKAEMEPWVKNELSKALKTGVKAEFTKKISGGFTIGPADGSYFVSFSDETFDELISEYLRPVTKKILFG